MNYLLHILILVNIYTVLALSLNLLAGYTGLLALCQAAFYGIGAYSTAILSLRAGWPWLGTVGFGVLLSAVVAAGIGYTSLRLRNDYFVIATFAFQVILYSIMLNWTSLTQGPMGLPGVPNPSIFGFEIDGYPGFVLLSLALAVVTFLVINRLVASPYGRVLRAIREDEIQTQALAKRVTAFKVSAFAVGAALAAAAGSVYASYMAYVDPSSFTPQESIFILAVVIVGGAGNTWGSVAGAAVLVAVPEALRFLGLPSAVAANTRQILYGGLLVACMMWRPQGLLGEYTFRRKES